MTGYRFALDCAQCAGPLAHVAGAAGTGTQAVAVARCEACGREYTVTVHLRVLRLPEQGRDTERARRRRLVAS